MLTDLQWDVKSNLYQIRDVVQVGTWFKEDYLRYGFMTSYVS